MPTPNEFLPQGSKEATIARLHDLMRDINANKGTINCGWVALRLDEILRYGPAAEHSPVPTADARMHTQIKYKDAEIIRSYTQDPRLLALHQASNAEVAYDLTDEDKVIIELDQIEAERKSADADKKLKLRKVARAEVLDTLKRLTKDKYGRAYGFMIYTLTGSRNRTGHIVNFYVDANNEVYILDAQGADAKTWVLPEPPREGYKEELFFLQSLPPIEHVAVKVEAAAAAAVKQESTSAELNPQMWQVSLAAFAEKTPSEKAEFIKQQPFLVEESIKLYSANKESVDVNVLLIMGIAYGSGMHVAKNMQKAFDCYSAAAAKGHSEALSNLGRIYQNHRGKLRVADGAEIESPNMQKAFDCYSAAAAKGDALALNNLGVIYQNHRGKLRAVDGAEIECPNTQKAFECYSAAAAKENAAALNNLGGIYQFHRGNLRAEDGAEIECPNIQKAFECYSAAAAKGHAAGLNNLGVIYQHHRGKLRVADGSEVECPNIQKAFECYSAAAAKGYAAALNNLGGIYQARRGNLRTGDGIEIECPNMQKAFECYSAAAAKGEAVALNNLGVIYKNHLGKLRVADGSEIECPDMQKAVESFSAAVAKGEAAALNNLGVIYKNHLGKLRAGDGAEIECPNMQKAFECLSAAAAKGDAVALTILGGIYKTHLGKLRAGDGAEIECPNMQKAFECYSAAAAKGGAVGLHNLGVIYKTHRGKLRAGDGAEVECPNTQKAFECYRAAVAKGYQPARDRLQSLQKEEFARRATSAAGGAIAPAPAAAGAAEVVPALASQNKKRPATEVTGDSAATVVPANKNPRRRPRITVDALAKQLEEQQQRIVALEQHVQLLQRESAAKAASLPTLAEHQPAPTAHVPSVSAAAVSAPGPAITPALENARRDAHKRPASPAASYRAAASVSPKASNKISG